MKFGIIQRRIFRALDGTYSVVTERENFDSQITLTDYEAEMAISHFGKENLLFSLTKLEPALKDLTLPNYTYNHNKI